MDIEEIIRRLEKIAEHAIHTPGETPFCMSLDDGIALHEAVERLRTIIKQEPREITKEEWELWKKDKHRDPLCMYWRGDITPFWILRPEEVHEPAYLIGDIKIFKGKPDKETMHRMWQNTYKM